MPLKLTGMALRRNASLPSPKSARCVECGFRVGSCGCGGGVPSGRVPVVPRTATGGGNGMAGSGNFQANPLPTNDGGRDGWWNHCSCDPGCFPNGFDQGAYRSALRDVAPSAPYADPMMDFVNMDTLYSDITTVAAAATVNVEVEPEAGCFLAFYYRIIVRTDADGMQQVDWTYRKPRVSGCPVACDNIDRNIMGQFAMSVPEACPCGIPLRAFLQRPSENLPLIVPVTNGGAAAITAQVEVRGFCCSTRIC